MMENLAADLISLLQYLLPGFLAAWIYYSFTSFALPSQFERIVEALIFTLIIKLLTIISAAFLSLFSSLFTFGVWSSEVELFYSVLYAVLLGCIFAHFSNTDKLHSLVRKLKITKETSYPSEWFGEFNKYETYVVLHLKDNRRIYGWPAEWPSNPDKGHFSIAEASWLKDDGTEIKLDTVRRVLIPANTVNLVEFMKKH